VTPATVIFSRRKIPPASRASVVKFRTIVSDAAKTRATSHAKSVDLTHDQSALDRARALKEQFQRVQSGQEHAREQQNIPQQQRTGEQSHAPRPQAHLRPQGQIRRAVDRQIDKEKLAKENERARQANAEYQARQRQANLNRTKDMDRDM
jgi:hypothetical protein